MSLRHQLFDALLTQRYLNAAALIILLSIVNASGIIVALVVLKTDSSQITYEKILYNTIECPTGSSESQKVFTIYDFHRVGANNLARRLCTDPAFTREFKTIQVRWHHETIENLRNILDYYDLVVASKPLMQSAHLGTAQLFEPIASYPDYQAVLLSREPILDLSMEGLFGKRIGLLDNRVSQSGHLIARGVFEQAGISLEDLDIHYFTSHREVRQALLDNAVDIIASYWYPEKDEKRFGAFNRKVLLSTPGYQWYLKRQWIGTPVECALEDALKADVRAATSDYFKSLEFLRECTAG